MHAFLQFYPQKKSGFVCALSSGILILGLVLAAPAAYAGMGGGAGAAAGAGAWRGGAGAAAAAVGRSRSRRRRGREPAEAGALGAAEQLIARMVKRNLRSALGVWF